ncbi:hypothetical protein HK096_001368 [Nowakowskiella sp. JEL0078]|nr:hypothetical protein HK096_001368 [Nowakowskiella sp. JEL0078]
MASNKPRLEIVLDVEFVEVPNSDISYLNGYANHSKQIPILSGRVILTTPKPLLAVKDLTMNFVGRIKVSPPLQKKNPPFEHETPPPGFIRTALPISMTSNHNQANSKLIPLYPSFTQRTIIEKQSVLWRHVKYLSQPERLVTDYSINTDQQASELNPQQLVQIPVDSNALLSAKSSQPFIPAVNSSDGFSTGVHEFPFLLRIPANIPPTTNLSNAKVEYILSANLRRKGLSSDVYAECDVILLAGSMAAESPVSPVFCQPTIFMESVLLDAESMLRATIVRPPYVFAVGNDNEVRKRCMQITLKLDILMPQLVSEIKKVMWNENLISIFFLIYFLKNQVTCFMRQWIRYGDSTTLASEIEFRNKRTRSIDRRELKRRQSIKENMKEVRVPHVVDCINSVIVGDPVEYIYDKSIVDFSETPIQSNLGTNQTLRSVTRPVSPSLRPVLPSNHSLRSNSNPDHFDIYLDDANTDSRRSRAASFSSSTFVSSYTLPSVTKTTLSSGNSLQHSYPPIALEIPLDLAIADVHEPELDVVHVLRIRVEIKTSRSIANSSGSIYEGNSPSKLNFVNSMKGRQRGLSSSSSVVTNNSEDDDNYKFVDFELKIPVLSFYKQSISSKAESQISSSPKSAGSGIFSKPNWFGLRRGTMSSISDSFSEVSSIDSSTSSDQQNFLTENSDPFPLNSQRQRHRTFSTPFSSHTADLSPRPNRNRAKTSDSQRSESSIVELNSDITKARKSLHGPGNIVYVNEDQLKLQRKSKASLLENDSKPPLPTNDHISIALSIDPKTEISHHSNPSKKSIQSQCRRKSLEIIQQSSSQIENTESAPERLEDINYGQLTFDELNALVGRLVNTSKPHKPIKKKLQEVKTKKSSQTVLAINTQKISREESHSLSRKDISALNSGYNRNIDTIKELNSAQNSYVMPLKNDVIRAPLSGVVVVPASSSNDEKWKLDEDIYFLED